VIQAQIENSTHFPRAGQAIANLTKFVGRAIGIKLTFIKAGKVIFRGSYQFDV